MGVISRIYTNQDTKLAMSAMRDVVNLARKNVCSL